MPIASIMGEAQLPTDQLRGPAGRFWDIAGVEVKTDKFVYGIRLHFRRVKRDGTPPTRSAWATFRTGLLPFGLSSLVRRAFVARSSGLAGARH